MNTSVIKYIMKFFDSRQQNIELLVICIENIIGKSEVFCRMYAEDKFLFFFVTWFPPAIQLFCRNHQKSATMLSLVFHIFQKK